MLSKPYRNVKLDYPKRNRLTPNVLGSSDQKHIYSYHDYVLPKIVRFPNSTSQKKTNERGLEHLATLVKTFENDNFVDDIEGGGFKDDPPRYFNPTLKDVMNLTRMHQFNKPFFLGQDTFGKFEKKYPTLSRLLQTTTRKMSGDIRFKGTNTFTHFTVFEELIIIYS